MDGGFQGREHVITPWSKPPKRSLTKRQAQYNDGHSFIRSRGMLPTTHNDVQHLHRRARICGVVLMGGVQEHVPQAWGQ